MTLEASGLQVSPVDEVPTHNAMPSGLSGTCWSLWIETSTFKVSKGFFFLIFVSFKFEYNFAKRLLDQSFSTFTCCWKIRQKKFCEEADNMKFNIKIKNG